MAKDKAAKDLNLFAVDELGLTQKALKEAKKKDERCEAEMKRKEQAFDQECEELKWRFEVHKKYGMKEVTKKFKDARGIVDDKTTEANEKS